MGSVRKMSLDELSQHDGTDPSKPIYVSVKGLVYDVTELGKSFYGPGGPYAVFAGRDATRALAKMSKEPSDLVSSSLLGLSDKELAVLLDWENKFRSKYPLVATLSP